MGAGTRWAQALERLAARHWWRPRPSALALALLPLSALYTALAALNSAPYRWGWRRARRAPVPVIVVGNLIAGGAGKTPTVIAVVEALRAAGWRPGVISRGHGRVGDAVAAVRTAATAAEVGDEPLLIHQRTGVPVWVGRRRALAASALCAAHPEVNVLVSDDGLQHPALARDVEIVVFDERGAGNGLRLPAGPLRQALPARLPPRTLVLYNAAAPSTALPGALATRRLGDAVPLADWRAGDRRAAVSLGCLQADGRPPLLAAAGVASPERFFGMLEAAGLVITRLPLPDHHAYDSIPWPAGTPDVITTEKDAIKLQPGRLGATRVWVVGLDFALPAAFNAAWMSQLDHTRPLPIDDDHRPPTD
jgi:tetraacyldisaccharide 4'-kinase